MNDTITLEHNVRRSFSAVKSEMFLMKKEIENQKEIAKQVFENQKQLLLRLREIEKRLQIDNQKKK